MSVAEQAKPSPLKRVRAALVSARENKPAVLALVVSAVALLLLYAAALAYLRPSSPGRELSFDALQREAASKRIQAATFLDEDARVIGTLAPSGPGAKPATFWSSYPRSDAATNVGSHASHATKLSPRVLLTARSVSQARSRQAR